MSLRKKLWIAAGCGLAVALAMPGYIALERSPPDDSDLTVVDTPLRYDDNALRYLLEAARACIWSDDTASLRRRVLRGDDWDERELESLLRANRPALDRLQLALAAPGFRLPSADASGELDVAPEVPVETRHLVALLELRAAQHAHRGRWESAFADSLDILRLSQRLEAADGAVVTTVMIGVSVRGIGLDSIRRITLQAPIDAARARRWTGALPAYRSDPAAWKRMWASEYQHWKRMLNWITDQRDAGRPGRSRVEIADAADAAAPSGLPTQPSPTLARFAELTRSFQRASEQSCSRIEEPPDISSAIGAVGPGSRALRIATPDYRDIFLRRCYEDFALGATQVLIALKAHRNEHGALPERLEELVPAYIGSIPVDAFDGGPIRYSGELGVVYSVGSDGVDSGGHPGPLSGEFGEPSFLIRF